MLLLSSPHFHTHSLLMLSSPFSPFLLSFPHKPAPNHAPVLTKTSIHIMRPATFVRPFFILLLSSIGPSQHCETRSPRSYATPRSTTGLLRVFPIWHRAPQLLTFPALLNITTTQASFAPFFTRLALCSPFLVPFKRDSHPLHATCALICLNNVAELVLNGHLISRII